MSCEEIYKDIELQANLLSAYYETESAQDLIDLLLSVETALFRDRIKLERSLNH